jgi:glycerol uptake facilitator-like aquaporin
VTDFIKGQSNPNKLWFANSFIFNRFLSIVILMKNRIFIGEFIGSAFLVMIIVGSGIMAQNLTKDFAVMLLANTLATGAGLFVLINSIANISGAHFNPLVTMTMYFTKKIKKDLIFTYLSAQILGCLLGVMLANFMFDFPLIELSRKIRPGVNIFVAELIKPKVAISSATKILTPGLIFRDNSIKGKSNIKFASITPNKQPKI